MVYAKEGKKELFLSTMVWRPSTNERAHSSFVALTTAAVAVNTSTRLWPKDHRPGLLFIVLWKALYHAGRGDGSLHSPVYGLYSREGMVLYRPLHSVLYRGGAALYCPLCSVFYSRGDGSLPSPVFGFTSQGEGGSLPSPVSGFTSQGGRRLSTVPCSVLYITVGGQLSTVPCVRFYMVIVQA